MATEFRHRGRMTQKKEYNIQNTAKVSNQEKFEEVFEISYFIKLRFTAVELLRTGGRTDRL